MYVIAVINEKGGVGKTSTAVALTTFLHHRGYRPLILDLDAQMNATKWLLGRELEPDEVSIYQSLLTQRRGGARDWPLADLIEESENLSVDFVPSGRDMAEADAGLQNSLFLLRNRLDELRETTQAAGRPYDVCVLDCPPSLGTVVRIALVAADGILVPVKADQFSMDGLRQLTRTVQEIRQMNPELSLLGILINAIDRRYGEVNEDVARMREFYGDTLFETMIPLRARIVEATKGLDLYEHAKAKGSEDVIDLYNGLVDEIIDRTHISA